MQDTTRLKGKRKEILKIGTEMNHFCHANIIIEQFILNIA